VLEIDALVAFRQWIASGPGRPPAACQQLDLSAESALEVDSFADCLFLGCQLTRAAAAHLVGSGAIVIPATDRYPFAIHRAALYRPDELFAGFDGSPDGYAKTFDHRVHRHYVATGRQYPRSIAESLARRLHDHAMTDALEEAIAGQRVVAIMGGHGLERRDPEYRTVARIARTLTRTGFLMVSGGGPGAMEATHLGAWFAHYDAADLDEAIALIGERPAGAPAGKEYADADWLHRAWTVRERWPVAHLRYHSIGIPTWLYGHEPPALFATQIAKYFANSVREEGLLAIAEHGVIFAKGSAGTTQEIFQDATQNHYASFGQRSPMILLGSTYWTETLPVWPLLQVAARGRVYDELLCLTDDEHEVVRRITSYDPAAYRVVKP
jgi:predicted Rossmann-fold nucleotide-binding protein